MKRLDNFSRFADLRKEFSYFSYDAYQYHHNDKHLEISFVFSLSGKYFFRPEIIIPYKSNIFRPYENLSGLALDNLVFHIGMIELISYWKAACPEKLLVRPHRLTHEQINFWKKLYYNGLGEFFYMNSIQTGPESFMEIIADEGIPLAPFREALSTDSIIPVGGGKDSAVSLGILNKAGADWVPFAINPRGAIREVIQTAGKAEDQMIEFHREIHPQLLRLNEAGFLNGHTPFSALLAFHSLLAALLAGRSEILLSNESSANEATVPGTSINHQYSKSFEFEADFREYVRNHISGDFNYYSLLRPLSEIQIAAIFSKMPGFFPAFKSCNVRSSSDSWCGACPKCLFTYVILSPFLEPETLRHIFGKDLLNDPGLKDILDELTGITETKPFECIGTVDEVKLALALSRKKYPETNLPYLLSNRSESHSLKDIDLIESMKRINPGHFVPEHYLNLLKEALE